MSLHKALLPHIDPIIFAGVHFDGSILSLSLSGNEKIFWSLPSLQEHLLLIMGNWSASAGTGIPPMGEAG